MFSRIAVVAACLTIVAAVFACASRPLPDPAIDAAAKNVLELQGLTPGGVALLASHTRDPGVAERIALALASAIADTRAVAARIVNLGAMRDLLPAVQAALEREVDAEAARELIRTLCSLGGSTFDETALAATRTFSPRLDGHVARILARTRGPESLSFYFSSLRQLQLTAFDRASFFRLATRGKAEALADALSRAFGHRDEAAWQAILGISADLPTSLERPILIQALRSDDIVFRGEAAWYLAKTHDRVDAKSAAEILDAVSEAGVAPPASDPELRFGAEMLRRVLGKAAVEDEGWIACLESNPHCHLDSDFLESPLVDYLTPREREAVARRNHSQGLQGAGRGGKRPAQPANRPTMRILPGLPRGMAQDLIAVTACRSDSSLRLFSVADLAFRADGLPRHVTLQTVPKGSSCLRAAEALFLMSLAPESEWTPPDSKLTYVALFDPDSAACRDAGAPTSAQSSASAAAADIVRVRAQVIAPKLLNKVNPTYPEAALKNHKEGVSIYEGVITTAGCVGDIRLLKSSSPLLDVAGLEAVSRWKYSPATLNGRPVRVYLTVTVTYNLGR